VKKLIGAIIAGMVIGLIIVAAADIFAAKADKIKALCEKLDKAFIQLARYSEPHPPHFMSCGDL
jgi:uncharacterized membrane-anchored protein YhcB (DUF1043 family)